MYDYPLPIAAYLPDLPLMKKAPAIPPNTAPAMTDAPTTPFASRYGVPDPAPGFSAADTTRAAWTLRASSKVACPVSPASPTLPRYCADATDAAPMEPIKNTEKIVAVKSTFVFIAFTYLF